MKTYITLAILMLSLIVISCEDIEDTQLKESENVIAVNTDQQITSDPRMGPNGEAMSKSSNAVTDTINKDAYEIIFTDHYGDPFYLNLKTAKDGYYFYRGVWTNGGHVFACTASYDSYTKTFALNGYYKESMVMMYHLSWYSENYFDGKYTWLYAGLKEYNSLYKMNIRISKGEFPGANE